MPRQAIRILTAQSHIIKFSTSDLKSWEVSPLQYQKKLGGSCIIKEIENETHDRRSRTMGEFQRLVLADRWWSLSFCDLFLVLYYVLGNVTAESGAVKWVPRADDVF